MTMMTSTFPNARSILFSSPGLHEGSIKKEPEKEREDFLSSTIPSSYEEMSEDGRRRRATWEKCKASKNRSICLWVMIAFVVYVITLVFIFGITYESIKMSEKTSLSNMDVMMTERSHRTETEKNFEFARLPLLWTFQFEKLQQIATIILQISDVHRRMYRVSAAFRNYETNVTTMKFMTGEELEVSSEMGKLSDSKGVTIAYWDFKNGPQTSLGAALEEMGGSSISFVESGEAVKIPTRMLSEKLLSPGVESQPPVEGILSPRKLGNQFLDYIIRMKMSALNNISRYVNTILGANKGGSIWNRGHCNGGSNWNRVTGTCETVKTAVHGNKGGRTWNLGGNVNWNSLGNVVPWIPRHDSRGGGNRIPVSGICNQGSIWNRITGTCDVMHAGHEHGHGNEGGSNWNRFQNRFGRCDQSTVRCNNGGHNNGGHNNNGHKRLIYIARPI